ncbi:hypothetical protein COEREDRAFT_8177 [Coemansia reversa NRRL 1564]|uniref:Uncharacterized protein n=1 Tax=Coemansia reversa (strain ATCC 12441 / NRRL 1564) TaxID=763665 RepID=A0A2G5BCG3_COERN|nr:hypothetical protein COEREDRAFT_8177 [Coemansia reversa NRRL 1564]|eukprot:PIA16703.1 hypothetical protein COEREDRAFT_8177 [Coemansia reversa NRRL 1564]
MADRSIYRTVFGLIRPVIQRKEVNSNEDEEIDEYEGMEIEANTDEAVIASKIDHNVSETEVLITAGISTQTDIDNGNHLVVITRTDALEVATHNVMHYYMLMTIHGHVSTPYPLRPNTGAFIIVKYMSTQDYY